MFVNDLEAPMFYIADNGSGFEILVMDIMRYPETDHTPTHPRGVAQVTWRWIVNKNIGGRDNKALTEIRTQQYQLHQRWPYKPNPYVIEELPWP
jgi:hypothetical protein